MMSVMKLNEWRNWKQLTKGEVAEMADVSGVSVGRYEAGTRVPKPEVMVRIASMTNGAVMPNDWYGDVG